METKADLRAQIERLTGQIKEAQKERAEALNLVDEMGEQVEDANALIESWIEAFDMVQTDDGLWTTQPSQLRDEYAALVEEHQKLVRDWNRFVGEYNSTVAPRDLGRPLQASDDQVKQVRKLRKKGVSLRAIAAETGLGLRTVRTITEKDSGIDRTSKRTNLLRRRELDRLRAAEYRSRKRTRDQLPKRVNETLKRGEALVKAAKGLDGGSAC
jgi:hypothetical protein